MTEIEPFLFENDLRKALENNDGTHISKALEALAAIGRPLSPELTDKLAKYLNPETLKKTGPKTKWLNYNCGDGSESLKWLMVRWDYEYLCKKEHEDIARFVVNFQKSLNLPIFLQDASQWNLMKYQRFEYPKRDNIKAKLGVLYGICLRHSDNYSSGKQLGEGVNDLIQTVSPPGEVYYITEYMYAQELSWVRSDYEYLCKKGHEDIARFVVNCEDSLDLPISLQDASQWNLMKYQRIKYPRRDDIKERLCGLYGILRQGGNNTTQYIKEQTKNLKRISNGLTEFEYQENEQFTQELIKEGKKKFNADAKIEKIISNGQSGASRAALDAAIELGIKYGGWVPPERMSQGDQFCKSYKKLKSLRSGGPLECLKKNIINSEGSLFFSNGTPPPTIGLVQKYAHEEALPFLHIDFKSSLPGDDDLVSMVRGWLQIKKIKILNVTGPLDRSDNDIYEKVKSLILCIFGKN